MQPAKWPSGTARSALSRFRSTRSSPPNESPSSSQEPNSARTPTSWLQRWLKPAASASKWNSFTFLRSRWSQSPEASTDAEGDLDEYALEGIDESVLSLLYKAAKVTGYELRFYSGTREFTFVTAGGVDRGIGFRYGRNVRTLKRRTQAPAATRLYAFGASGLDLSGRTGSGELYVEDFSYYTGVLGLTEEEARSRFTRSVVWTDSAFVDDEALYKAALAKVAELAVPTVEYELDVVDLSAITGLPEDTFEVGDTVRVRDPELDLDLRTRVVRIVRNELDPSSNVVELAYRPDLTGLEDGGSRAKDSLDWILLDDTNEGTRKLGADWTTILASIGVSFTQGGNVVHGIDVEANDSGSGEVELMIYDTEAALEVRKWTVPFGAGRFHFSASWSERDIDPGGYRYELRARIVSGSGTFTALTEEAHYWIMAQGGLGQLPTPPANSIRFDYLPNVLAGDGGDETGDQFWTVPDGVTVVDIVVAGAHGGCSDSAFDTSAFNGKGNIIGGRLAVTPGETLKIRVGDSADEDSAGGWPGGGTAARGGGGKAGYGGGGYTGVLRAPFLEVDASTHDFLIVAGGGGSHDTGSSYPSNPVGSAAGYPDGEDGVGPVGTASGGLQNGPGPNGTHLGAWLEGASGIIHTNSFHFYPGGGGAGWYGGNHYDGVVLVGGGYYGGDGGGGSSYFDPAVLDAITEGPNTERDGYVVISWENPSDGIGGVDE